MFDLDLSQVKENSFAPIAPGTYFVIMDECAVKETKSGTGSYINAKYRILNGQNEGKFIFHMFNIKNENPKAVEIGLGQLKTFMKCSGSKSERLTDVLDLIGMRCDAVVKIRHDDGYGDKAVISYFKPRPTDGSAQPQASTPQPKSPFG